MYMTVAKQECGKRLLRYAVAQHDQPHNRGIITSSGRRQRWKPLIERSKSAAVPSLRKQLTLKTK